MGEIFGEFASVIVAATLMSLFVSFTLTPMMASRWSRLMSRKAGSWSVRFADWWEERITRLNGGYRRLLERALDRRKTVLGISAATLVGSVAMIPLHVIGTEFMTQVDRGEFSVSLEMPAGTALDRTDGAVQQFEEALARTPEVDRFFTTVGKSEEGILNSQAPYMAQTQVHLVKRSARRRTTDDVITELKGAAAQIPGLKARVNFIGIFGTADDTPLFIEVKGQRLEDLVRAAADVEARTARTPGTADVKISWEEGKPEVRVTLDREKAAQMGLTLGQVALALRMAFEGDVATQFRDGETEVDTRVIVRKLDRSRVEDVGRMSFLNDRGQLVELRQIAQVTEGTGPTVIERKNRERLITIQSNLSGRPLGDVVRDLKASFGEIKLPEGVTIFFAGDAEMQEETFTKMVLALLLGIAFVYMIMVALFESYLHPFTIMFSLPVAVVGALGGLALTGKTINMFSMIGVIMLVGLVTKNAILLVDYTNHLRARGMGVREALLEAGPARLRPIIMTTLTLILGMLPLALSLGPGTEMRSGMAVVMIGGLTTSTLLTLVLVPVVYTIMEDLRVRVPVLLGRKAGTAEAAAAAD